MLRKIIQQLKQAFAMKYENLDAETFREKIETTNDALVIDVRSEAELSEGSIPGYTMINMFSPDFALKIEKLDKNKSYFVYCRSGNRSSSACNFMTSKGFEKVYNLSGGIGAWNKLMKQNA